MLIIKLLSMEDPRMKKLLVFLTMVVFSLGLMSACPEKKEEPAPASDTETMEKKTDEGTTTEEGTKEETDGIRSPRVYGPGPAGSAAGRTCQKT